MSNISVFKAGWVLFRSVFLLSFLLMQSNCILGGNFFITGSMQYLSGKYDYNSITQTYYFNTGIWYQSTRWSVAANLPLIAQTGNLVNQVGNIFMPDQNMHGGTSSTGQSHHGGGMISSGIQTLDHYEYGVGDLYIFGHFDFLSENSKRPTISLSPQIKVPLASTSKNFGTEKFDYGLFINLHKIINNYSPLIDLGFLYTGDPPGYHYKNPFVFGAGISRFFKNGKYSGMIYYQSYSKIIENYESPRQISFVLYHTLSSSLNMSLTGAFGLSNSSPGVYISVGFRKKI